MGNMSAFDQIMEKKLMDLHCGYIGKVIWTDGATATVQPLGLIKERDGAIKAQAPVSDVPVACRYKLSVGEIMGQQVAVPREIQRGDLVACLCADRDITEARRGNNELPPPGRHSISDSIIVGIL